MSHYPYFDAREKIDLPENWDFAFLKKVSLEEIVPEKLSFTDHLSLPGCFDSSEKFAGLKGTGCYLAGFRLKKTSRLRLHLGGMGLSCRIFCDGKELGDSRLPFTPLYFDFMARAGKHVLLIAINNQCDETRIPQFQLGCDFYAYGGIYYDLTLQILPEFHFERVKVSVLDLNAGRVGLDVSFGGNLPERAVLSIAFEDSEAFTENCRIIDGHARFEAKLPVPRLWTPETPHLHCVRCEMKGDSITERFGLRTVEVCGRNLLLNGKPLKLLGFNRHEHHPDFGYTLPDAIHVNDLMLMKKCGCNFIRGSHYPQNQGFLDRCDEMGFLVWEESLAWGKKPAEKMLDPVFREAERRNITAMIRESINHPSVILWGFCNECASNEPEAIPVYKELAELVKKLDPSRPVTFAVIHSRDHVVFDFADVIAMNCYPGWYDTEEEEIRTVDNIKPFLKETLAYIDSLPGSRNKPFIISETGADALSGFHDRFHARWTEEYQADFHREVTDFVCGEERVCGVALWMFCDTRTGMQGRILRRPRGYNNKGVFDEYRRPKEAVSVITQAFTHCQKP